MSELKGIFAWEKTSAHYIGRDEDGVMDFYKFPLMIKTGTLDEDEDRKFGYLFFKSGETIRIRRNNFEKTYKISGAPAAIGALLGAIIPNCIFCEAAVRKKYEEFRYAWAKTAFYGKDVFLFEDAFIENGLVTDDSGKNTSVCLLPFSEYGPLKHLNAEGGYDFSEIATWDVYRVDNVAYFEEDPI